MSRNRNRPASGSESSVSQDAPTVLVVDDDAQLVRLHATWLETECHVRTATKGSEALEQLDEAVDVVLLDRQMPWMSGSDVLKEIRASDVSPQVAIVSGLEPDVDVIEMAFDEYLLKPVSQEQLLLTVKRLARRTNWTESVRQLSGLASKLALLETYCSSELLAEREEYAVLRDRYEALKSEINDEISGRASGVTLVDGNRFG